MIEWIEFASWIFYGALTVIAMIAVRILAKMNDSINELNLKVGVMLTNIDWHKEMLQDHDARLKKIETQN